MHYHDTKPGYTAALMTFALRIGPGWMRDIAAFSEQGVPKVFKGFGLCGPDAMSIW